MPLSVTRSLASFQPQSNATVIDTMNRQGQSAGPAPSNSPLGQLNTATTRHAAMQTLSDPAFWRARMFNRLGYQTHDDPAVNRYLSTFQANPQGGMPGPGALLAPAAGALGAGLVGGALSGALRPGS